MTVAVKDFFTKRDGNKVVDREMVDRGDDKRNLRRSPDVNRNCISRLDLNQVTRNDFP